MNSLQSLRVEEARRVSQDHPSIARQRRDCPPAAIGQRFRTVADHFAAFEQPGHERMPLELLQHSLRIEARIGVVQAGYKPQRDHVVLAAVNPCAAVFTRSQRPAQAVDHLAGSDLAERQFPELLDALTVGLRVAVFGEVKFVDELLGERPARPFRENDDLRLKIVTWLEIRLRLILLVESLVVSANPRDPVAVEQQFGTGKAGEHGDSGLLDFAAQPLHKTVERNDVIAMIAQRWRSNREFEVALLGEEVNAFLRNRGIEWRFLFKVGKQLAHRTRIEQCAREAVLTNFAGLLEDVNVFFAELSIGIAGVVLVDELCKMQRTGHPGGPAAHNNDIGGHLRAFDIFGRFTEDEHGRRPKVKPEDRNQASPAYAVPRACGAFEALPYADFAFFTSSISGGTISNRFPTTATSAISKIGASESLLTATTERAPFIPTTC